MDDHASQRGPRHDGQQPIPPPAPLRREGDPQRNLNPPQRARRHEAQFRLQHEPDPARQLEAMMRRREDRDRHGRRAPGCPPLSTCHGLHLTTRHAGQRGGHPINRGDVGTLVPSPGSVEDPVRALGLPHAWGGGPRQWTVLLSGRTKRSWAVVAIVLGAAAVAVVATIAATAGSPPLTASRSSGRAANSAASPLRRPEVSPRPQGQRAHPPTTPAPSTSAPATPAPVALAGCPVPPQPPLPAAPAPWHPAVLVTSLPPVTRAGAVDLARRSAHREGDVDLAVGQHRRRRRRRGRAAGRFGGTAPAVGPGW